MRLMLREMGLIANSCKGRNRTCVKSADYFCHMA